PGPATFTGRGYRLVRGASILITNANDIAYFQAQGGISCEVLADVPARAPSSGESTPPPPPPPAAKPKAKVEPAPAPPVATPPETESDDDDEPEDWPEESAGSAESETESSGETEGEGVELESLTRAQLLEFIAANDLNIKIDANANKATIRAAIEAALKG